MTTPAELFAELAQKHLAIDTLETRGSDSLDFHAVGVEGLRRALRDAYQAGLNSRGEAARVAVHFAGPEYCFATWTRADGEARTFSLEDCHDLAQATAEALRRLGLEGLVTVEDFDIPTPGVAVYHAPTGA